MKSDSTHKTPRRGGLRNKHMVSFSDAQDEDLRAYQKARGLLEYGDDAKAIRELFDLGIKSWKRKNR